MLKCLLDLLTSAIILSMLLLVRADDIIEDALEDVDLVPGVPVHLSDGLIVTQIKGVERCVRQAEEGDTLTIEYEGRYNSEEGEVFDETRSKQFPFRFELGGGGERGGRVIEGLTRGVRGMCRGEIRNILIPPQLA